MVRLALAAVLALTAPALAQSTAPATRAAPPAPIRLPGNSQRDYATQRAIAKGLEFLTLWQSPNGSWDRLENPDPIQLPDSGRAGRVAAGHDYADGLLKDLAEDETEHVADTALAGLAMLEAWRASGRTRYARNLLKTTDFLCKQVDKWDEKSIYIQKRVFDPLHDQTTAYGELRFFDPTVDTFFTLWFLAEVQGKFSDAESEKRVAATLEKLMTKIEHAQDIHGTWPDETNPWRDLEHDLANPTISGPTTPKVRIHQPGEASPGVKEAPQKPIRSFTTHALATGALNIAVRRGVPYSEEVLRKADLYLRVNLNRIGDDDELLAAALFAFHHAELTNTAMIQAARAKAEKTANPALQRDLERKVIFLGRRATTLRAAKERVAGKLAAQWQRRPPEVVGVKLAYFPAVLEALTELHPGLARPLAARVTGGAMALQHGDGHFTYGSEAQRGDNTFGTAAALLILYQAPQDSPRPADQPAPPR